MTKDAYIKIKGNVEVCVPDDVRLLTHYVLREQEDWFEDEMEFIRVFIKPGMKIIDIGANYGIYTLTAAKLSGKNGSVWSFEPSSSTASFLRKGLIANSFQNTELLQAGLSNVIGQTSLVIHQNTEMCFLSDTPEEGATKETVELTTLDYCASKFKWKNIDLIKMDAEGHESKIIEGGKDFLLSNENSPLIMYEIKAGHTVNMNLYEKFLNLGYKSYIYIPGLNILKKFDPVDQIDDYQLNLFCCKDDRADDLEQLGLLVNDVANGLSSTSDSSIWNGYLKIFSYGQQLQDVWKNYMASETAKEPDHLIYQEALNHYVLSQSDQTCMSIKLGHLYKAYNLLISIDKSKLSLPMMITLIRVSKELGYRKHAVELLQKLIPMVNAMNLPVPTEPFLALSSVMESITTDKNIWGWMVTGILESFEKLRSYSSYYTGAQSLEIVNAITSIGHEYPEIERRRQLLNMCTNMQKHPVCNKLLKEKNDLNLNPEYWCVNSR